MRPLIGIDIGWSKNRRSCGVAVANTDLELPRAVQYGRGIRASCLRLDELVGLGKQWRTKQQDQLARAVVVIDGPLGKSGPPTKDRHVDAACGRGEFYGRCHPTQVSHPSSATFIEATYRVLASLGLEDRIWFGGSVPDAGSVVAETNPSVALPLMIEQQAVASLPSRSRALRLGDRLVRAKSDWYWAIGGCEVVANVLDAPGVTKERDHERVAALVCLGLAAELSRGEALALGDSNGIYVISRKVGTSWKNAVGSVGVVAGAPQFARAPARVEEAQALEIAVVEQAGGVSEDCEYQRGDDVDLFLCDSGGVNERYNGWLVDLASPVVVETLTKTNVEITLRYGPGRSRNPDQWVCNPTTTTLRAKLIAEVRGNHDPAERLSTKNSLAIPIRVLR